VDTVRALLVLAVVANAMLVGAGLDQHIKQLPARHRIGVVAFSEYSKAADLANGVAWYGVLGIGSAVLTLITAAVGLHSVSRVDVTVALCCAIVFTLAHSVGTARAAPINFSQRKAAGDPERLAVIFDRFTRWSRVRVGFQILTLLSVTLTLIITPL